MNLSEFCIKRPVFATVLSLLLIIIGVMGLNYLDTRFLPKFESNQLNIITTYAGASSKLIESSITTPVEEAVSGVEGIDTITSSSYQGYSQVNVELKDDANLNDVETKIRAKVDNVRSKLPDDVPAPQINEMGAAAGELMDVGFTDPNMSLGEINDYLKRNIVDNISQVQGIAQVNSIGSNDYTMQVHLDPLKMKARKITVDQVEQAIKNSNIELPAGKIKGLDFDYAVNTKTKLSTAKEFNHIVVKQDAGNVVRIQDIGSAKVAPDTSTESFVRINGSPGLLLSITASDDANPINSAKGVMQYLASIKDQLPGGMKVTIPYDQSVFMKGSVHEVYNSILFSIVCVLLVIFLFLGRLRAVLIPIVTIPICLMATFGVMWICGFTINIISLLALVLSIGLVVDDAIVMLENIYRHIENGEKPMTAAIKGSKEITFAVIAMTLTLAAVYAPVALIHGQISAIFKPFALTLAGAVIISGFVALTLSPMMCSRLLKEKEASSRFVDFIDGFFNHLASSYQSVLSKILNKRYMVVLAVIAITIGGGYLIRNINTTFMPTEDMGIVVGMINQPSGSNMNYVSEQADKISNIMKKNTSVQSMMAFGTTSQEGMDMSIATLKPYANRKQSAQQVSDYAEKKIALIPGLNASVFPPSFGGSMQSQLQFEVTANKSYQDLYTISKNLVKSLDQYPGLKNVKSSLSFDNRQYQVQVKRNLAARLGVSVNTINNVLATMLGGVKVSTINIDGKSYDVDAMGLIKNQLNINQLNQFSVNNNAGKLIPLSNLITVSSVLSQTKLNHYNRQRSFTISANLGKGHNLAQDIKYLQTALPKILPASVHYNFTGQAKQSTESQSSMGLIFLLALLVIYLVLAAQFESFLDPLIILFAVPFSVIGALITLNLFGGSINIYTIVGLVTLIGLISKHGILITQFANDLKERGESARAAVVKAAGVRLRPILMTTAAMIFGAAPLLFAVGASAVSREQIGIVIASGLLFGTFFSLILVPVIYSFMNQLRAFCKRKIL